MQDPPELKRRTVLRSAAATTMAGGLVGETAGQQDSDRSLSDYTNQNGVVDTPGLQMAINDWLDGTIETSLLQTVINHWLSGEPVSSSLSLDVTRVGSGSLTADGSDKADVSISATAPDGGPATGLNLSGSLWESDRDLREVQIQETGNGEYQASVSSELKGTHLLTVTAQEEDTTATLELTFESGQPDHFWVTNNHGPQPGDDELKAKFNLQLKDAKDNLVSPDAADYAINPPDNVKLEFEKDQQKELIQVKVGLEQIPTPEGSTWREFDLEVTENTTGQTRMVPVEFPLLQTDIEPKTIDGTDVMSVSLHSINFEPLNGFNVKLPFDEERFELVSTENGDWGEQTSFSRAQDGVYIFSESSRDLPTTEMGTVNIRAREQLGQTELQTDVERLEYDSGEPTTPEHTFKDKYGENKDFCITIWVVDDSDNDDSFSDLQQKVQQDISRMKTVFKRSRRVCCPAIDLDVDTNKIDSGDWNNADNDGDGVIDTTGGKDNSGDVPVPETSAEQDSLLSNFNSDCLDVYYVPDLPGIGALGTGGGEFSSTASDDTYDTNGEIDAGWAFVSSNEAAGEGKTLVHEVGHVMGELKHPDPSDVPESNIMLQTAKDKDPGIFSSDQCLNISNLIS